MTDEAATSSAAPFTSENPMTNMIEQIGGATTGIGGFGTGIESSGL